MGKSLKVGDLAPNFKLLSETGETVELKDFIGASPVVLFFYPKDNTTICTKEVCHFRDNFDEFKKINNAEILGISSDSVDSHKQFSKKNKLPFILLSDADERVRRLYGVPKTLGIVPGRVTYVIDKQGVIQHIFSSQLNYKKHVDEAISALKSI
ncbi:MAG: peroxiredoxin [Candidatus Dadabacteria bacterium]|nr:peroxiredoxin [Candidatus Dadabacteria bacterium]